MINIIAKYVLDDKKFKIPTPEFKKQKIKKLKFTHLKEFATNKLNIKYDKKVKKTELFDLVIENI